MKYPQFIFACKKCGHLLYVEKDQYALKRLLRMDCPNCGEDKEELWTLIGEGNYELEHA